MEIPEKLRNLYRHWQFHTSEPENLLKPEGAFQDQKLFQEISWFIKERLVIWRKKTRGEDPPYTEDPILSTYRFCNIFREFDRQTIEFHTLLNPLRNNFPLWLLNMFYCRMVARPETIKYAGLLSFNEKQNAELYKKLMSSPRPRFGTPYVFPVSVIQRSQTPTRELFIAKYLPNIMREIAQDIQKWDKKSVYDGVEKLLPIFGFNLRFLWTEVLIDVAYQYPRYLDLFARFPVGPGSLPTLTRINLKKDPSLLVEELSQISFNTGVTYLSRPLRLSAENWEGIACEFRKYSNLKNGKGRRRLYK